MAEKWTKEWSEEMLARGIQREKDRHEKRLAKIAEREARPRPLSAAERRERQWARLAEALRLRREGKTMKQVGEAIGRVDGLGPLSVSRTSQILHMAERIEAKRARAALKGEER